ncbi:GIN domain-containing protein [Flavobacterium sp. U410]
MKKLTLLTLFIFSITFIQAQKKEKVKGSKIVTHTINEIESFENIEVEDNLEVYLVKGYKPSVEIEADDNLHDAINFSVAGNTLRVSSLKDVSSAKKFSIRINYTNDLKLVVAKGETVINALNELQGENVTIKNYGRSRSYLNVNSTYFTLILNDKSEAELNVKSQNTTLELSKNAELKALVASPEFKLDMYENSKANIEGDAADAKMRLDNNASLISDNLTLKKLELTVEGHVKTRVNVLEEIAISASGKAEIELYGQPKIEMVQFTNNAILYKKEK